LSVFQKWSGQIKRGGVGLPVDWPEKLTGKAISALPED
jgi:hypothetical protein